MDDQPEPVDEPAGGLGAALQLKGQEAAAVFHLAGEKVVLRMRRQARVMHARHFRTGGQPFGNGPPVTIVGLHAKGKRPQAAQHEPTIAAVTLCTLHAAKGLEWDDVHIVGLGDGLMPIGYARTAAAVEEERRLLYVGITRARRRLALSWAENAAGPREPSRFLAELGIRTEHAGSAAAR